MLSACLHSLLLLALVTSTVASRVEVEKQVAAHNDAKDVIEAAAHNIAKQGVDLGTNPCKFYVEGQNPTEDAVTLGPHCKWLQEQGCTLVTTESEANLILEAEKTGTILLKDKFSKELASDQDLSFKWRTQACHAVAALKLLCFQQLVPCFQQHTTKEGKFDGGGVGIIHCNA